MTWLGKATCGFENIKGQGSNIPHWRLHESVIETLSRHSRAEALPRADGFIFVIVPGNSIVVPGQFMPGRCGPVLRSAPAGPATASRAMAPPGPPPRRAPRPRPGDLTRAPAAGRRLPGPAAALVVAVAVLAGAAHVRAGASSSTLADRRYVLGSFVTSSQRNTPARAVRYLLVYWKRLVPSHGMCPSRMKLCPDPALDPPQGRVLDLAGKYAA